MDSAERRPQRTSTQVVRFGDRDRLDSAFDLPPGSAQAEGFVASLLKLMELDLDAPDHTVLSRRGKEVDLPELAVKPGARMHLIVDSTGLQISSTGAWSSDKYPKNKGKGWRKLHLGGEPLGATI